jgi:hypothetical protein
MSDLIQKIWALTFENLYLSPRSVSARHLPPSTLRPTLCIPDKAPCRHWGEGKSPHCHCWRTLVGPIRGWTPGP